MKLTYQTGVAALIHLAVISLFNILNGVHSSVQTCTNASNDCVGNIITSMLYFMLLTFWFAALWILAAAAQDRRSRKLAFLLIGCEGLVIMVSLFNAQHHNSWLGLITSLVDAALATWVALLALRIFVAGGGRVTASTRSRRRRLSN
ncbi:MAG: hypothetical protein JWN82_322 [Candidatus Saccharibacteria bacterium]|nr:hypothetical protein [Candidatus Saccharibacteria bacterium]